MTTAEARRILTIHRAQFVDEALADNPDGPVRMIITRTRAEIDYEVVIGHDEGKARAVWCKSVTFDFTDRTAAGGYDFVQAAREQDEVGLAMLELVEQRR